MERNVVIINEQHSLLPEQETILNEEFGNDWYLAKVPTSGLNKEEMKVFYASIVKNNTRSVVFASPIPYLIKMFMRFNNYNFSGDYYLIDILFFHNDKREKVELPNGKIIMKVSETGWELI